MPSGRGHPSYVWDGGSRIVDVFLPDEMFFHFCVGGSEMMCITGVKPPGAIVRSFMTPLARWLAPLPLPLPFF